MKVPPPPLGLQWPSHDCPYKFSSICEFFLIISLAGLGWAGNLGLSLSKSRVRWSDAEPSSLHEIFFFQFTFSRKLVSLLQSSPRSQTKCPAHLCKDPIGSCFKSKRGHCGSRVLKSLPTSPAEKKEHQSLPSLPPTHARDKPYSQAWSKAGTGAGIKERRLRSNPRATRTALDPVLKAPC